MEETVVQNIAEFDRLHVGFYILRQGDLPEKRVNLLKVGRRSCGVYRRGGKEYFLTDPIGVWRSVSGA